MKDVWSKLKPLRRKLDYMPLRVLAILTVALLVTLFAGRNQLAEIAWALSTTISVSPDSQTIAVGDSTTVDIRIEGVTNLHGAEVHLSFDPTILKVTGISEGDLLDGESGFTAQNVYSNTVGTIDYARTLLNVPSVSSNGVLITITFEGLGIGTSTIAFTDWLLSDRDGNVIPSSTSDGGITVVAASIGDRVWHDQDGDGSQTGGGWDVEGFNGVEVYLFQDDGDGVFEPGTTGTDRDGNFLYVTTTISGTSQDNYPDGIYGFDISEYDQYWVWVNESTLPGPGSGMQWASTTHNNPFYLDYPDGDDFSIDFGYVESGAGAAGGKIGDRVWHDQDGDGYQTGGWDVEGFNGVDVYLYASDPGTSCGSGSPLAITTTISGTSQTPDGFPDGIYEFNGVSLGLGAGDYWVCVDEGTLPSPGQGKVWECKTSNPQTVTYSQATDNFSIDFGYVATTIPTAATLSSFAARSSAGSEAPSVWLWPAGVVTLAMSGILWMRRRSNKPGYHG